MICKCSKAKAITQRFSTLWAVINPSNSNNQMKADKTYTTNTIPTVLQTSNKNNSSQYQSKPTICWTKSNLPKQGLTSQLWSSTKMTWKTTQSSRLFSRTKISPFRTQLTTEERRLITVCKNMMICQWLTGQCKGIKGLITMTSRFNIRIRTTSEMCQSKGPVTATIRMTFRSREVLTEWTPMIFQCRTQHVTPTNQASTHFYSHKKVFKTWFC
jgi:hypothetical protein